MSAPVHTNTYRNWDVIDGKRRPVSRKWGEEEEGVVRSLFFFLLLRSCNDNVTKVSLMGLGSLFILYFLHMRSVSIQIGIIFECKI